MVDRFQAAGGWMQWFKGFSVSTLAIVRLRSEIDFAVPAFKQEAADLYTKVGAALARGDEASLRRLVTRSCFHILCKDIRARPRGQQQTWQTHEVQAKVRQARIGHHASNANRQFAQVTCAISAKIVWTVADAKTGARIGGVGTSSLPHEVHDLVVFERCISQAAEANPAWRMKERTQTAPAVAAGETG